MHYGVPTQHSGVPVENPSEKPSRIIVNGKAICETELSKTKMEIPETFRCDICRSVLRTATVVPCCKKPFCKECILQRISYGGHCPVCHGTIKSEQLHIDKPLQERVNDFSKQLKEGKKNKKIPMDEYVQKKGVPSIPRTKPTALCTSFRHNAKPTFIISCLNCNEKGHVFKDCPKLKLKDEPPSEFSSTQVTSPSNIADTPVIVLSPKHSPTSPISLDPTPISFDSSHRIAFNDIQPKRQSQYFKREHRKRRKKRRRLSHSSSSRSLSSSRSRTARKRRQRRSRSKSKRKSFRSKSPLSVLSVAHDYSSSDHRDRIKNRTESNRRRRRGYSRHRIPSVSGSNVDRHIGKQRIWPVIRKPPRPKSPF